MPLYKADCIAAQCLRMIVLLVAADSDAVVGGQTLFAPGAEQTLTPVFKKDFQINGHSLLFLELGKGNVG